MALPIARAGGGIASSIGKLFGGTIVLIIIVVILGTIGTTTVLSNVTNLIDDSEDIIERLFKGSIPIPKPSEGEMVCDLKITIYAELDQFVPFTPFEVTVQDRVKEYHWTECHDASQFPLGALLDISQTVNDFVIFGILPTLILDDFLVPTEIKLIDPRSGVVIDSKHQRNLERDIKIRQGVNVPIDITETYAVKNIPHRDYKLEIHFPDNKINGMNVGKPLTDEVCTFDQETFPCV